MYFYHVDHQGRLYLDDAPHKNFTSCFRSKPFLRFFFSRLRAARHSDPGGHTDEFPWASPCGRELNYLRCETTPFVFVALEGDVLEANDGGEAVRFEPGSLGYSGATGIISHPHRGCGRAALSSTLAIDLSQHLVPTDAGTVLHYGGQQYRMRDDDDT